jgi:chemotaxis protein MotA
VVGGTAGAILLSTPGAILATAFRRCIAMLRRKVDERQPTIDVIVRYATLARRMGVSSIESEVEAMKPGFLRRALLMVVDGIASQEVRRQLENDLAAEEENAETDARVFEQAGGYAPTIGIIGAVLGLIQVMRHLGNVDEVGRGIAAAFISTLYGVAFANLLLLPIAARMRLRTQIDNQLKETILEGVTAIAEGNGLHVVRTRLDVAHEYRQVTPAAAPKVARKSA